jgi:CHAD domain-containing protein
MPITPERSKQVFQKVERDLSKLGSKRTTDSVHRFRTGARRLQTLLEELVPERDRNQKRLLKLLARLRKRTGKVRDLDVQLGALRTLKIPQEPRRKTQLINALIESRAEQDRKLRKSLSKEIVREIRKRLKRAAKELRLESSRDPLTVARQMLAQVTRPDGPLTEEVLHQYRILGKRARYVAELATKSTETDQFLAQLKRMQDALGDWHDWLTLTQTAAKKLGDVHESSLVAVLHNVTRVKFRGAVAALSASPVVRTTDLTPTPTGTARRTAIASQTALSTSSPTRRVA